MLMADEHLISLQPGTVIAGKYEVVKCLGAGSMGLVYACRHRELSGHLIAIKVLFPEVARDKIAAARFRNEIFASYGVSHPNVVRAYEYLRDGDLVAYTMEYVDGGDLAERLGDPDNLIPIPEIIKYLEQMCAGVQAIHDSGIIHRDLKPENILLTNEGNIKIADFGIARTGHGPKLTEHGGVVGTIDYVSPEYMLNSQVDWRSDIYALGILAYEMIAGESPFRADSVYATMTKRLKSDPVPPSSVRPECSKELDTIVLKAMERNPEVRYQSASEMCDDLKELRAGKGEHVVAKRATAKKVNEFSEDVDELNEEPVRDSGVDQTVMLAFDAEKRSKSSTQKGAVKGAGFGAGEGFSASSDGSLVAVENTQFDDETRMLEPGISEVSDEYQDDDTLDEPIRMERMLVYSDLMSGGGFNNRAESFGVNVMSGGIDNDRLRNLSQLVDNVQRSIWVDVLLLLVTFLLTIGVAFAFYRIFSPDVVTGELELSVERVVTESVD